MNKTLKIILIVAVTVIVLAIAATALALILQLDLKGLNPTKYVTNTHTVESGFTQIDIDAAECTVRFLPSQTGENTIRCSETERVTHTVEVVDDVLTIRRHDDRRWYEHFGTSGSKMTIDLYLADTAFESVQVRTRSGDIEISDQFTFSAASVSSSSGDISFSAQTDYALSASASSGDVYVGFSAPQQLTVSASSGKITLDSINSEAEITLTASSGSVDLANVICNTLSVDTSSGSEIGRAHV